MLNTSVSFFNFLKFTVASFMNPTKPEKQEDVLKEKTESVDESKSLGFFKRYDERYNDQVFGLLEYSASQKEFKLAKFQTLRNKLFKDNFSSYKIFETFDIKRGVEVFSSKHFHRSEIKEVEKQSRIFRGKLMMKKKHVFLARYKQKLFRRSM